MSWCGRPVWATDQRAWIEATREVAALVGEPDPWSVQDAGEPLAGITRPELQLDDRACLKVSLDTQVSVETQQGVRVIRLEILGINCKITPTVQGLQAETARYSCTCNNYQDAVTWLKAVGVPSERMHGIPFSGAPGIPKCNPDNHFAGQSVMAQLTGIPDKPRRYKRKGSWSNNPKKIY